MPDWKIPSQEELEARFADTPSWVDLVVHGYNESLAMGLTPLGAWESATNCFILTAMMVPQAFADQCFAVVQAAREKLGLPFHQDDLS